MSLSYRILGEPGKDNALLVRIDSGQAVEHILFDCGDGCLATLPFTDIREIDYLCFSHHHIDHVAGFDSFFRCNLGRDDRPNVILGPPGAAQIMQHRLQGFLWNLCQNMSDVTWEVREVSDRETCSSGFHLCEGFAVRHALGVQPGSKLEGQGFLLEAFTLEHHGPVLGYSVQEKPRRNIDEARMAALGLRPGPWLRELKSLPPGQTTVTIEGQVRNAQALAAELVVETRGKAVAYVTDFLLDDDTLDRLSLALHRCDTIVCEAQYRHVDLQLAQTNCHLTNVLAATLAKRAEAGELVLFHLSERYEREQWQEMLREAQEIFARTRFAAEWFAC